MKKRKKRENVINVPVASMGDIAFLLIIFFMVASHLTQERHNINPPMSLDAEEIKRTHVTVAIDRDGTMFLQGYRVDTAEEIESGMRVLMQNRTTQKERTVIFMCDQSIRRSKFEPVIEAIVNGGGLIAAVGDRGEPVVLERE